MSVVGRVAALAAVLVAVVGVAVLLLSSGKGPFKIKADFQNASQIVKGDLVQVAGEKAGKVTDIALTDNGQARLTLEIDPAYAPLRHGTQLTVRQASLSGIANRYVDLRLGGGNGAPYEENSVVPTVQTTSAVDLDELFNVFGPKERKALQNVIQGSALQYKGQGEAARRGWEYLNPALATTSMLFRELNRDTGQFTRFLVQNAHLVTDIAARRDDLAGLVDHLATTTGAIARPSGALASAIQQLPPFMRRANTTFVNLRSTLDYIRPLVEESKPVAKRLRPFLAQLRPLAQDAQPTIRDLARLTSAPGRANDLIELTASSVPLANATVRKTFVNGKLREGAFPASASALKQGTPELAFARPYAVDLTSWFDDFSHPGIYDAWGGASRVSPVVNVFSIQQSAGSALTQLPILPTLTKPITQARQDAFTQGTVNHQYDRCPGSGERDLGDGSTPWLGGRRLDGKPGCNPAQKPVGPGPNEQPAGPKP